MNIAGILKRIMSLGYITDREIKFIQRNIPIEGFDHGSLEGQGTRLEPSHNAKGLAFLMGLWKTPNGRLVSDQQLGPVEKDMLANFSHFTFNGFYIIGKQYKPLYICHDQNGDTFEYYSPGGREIIIIFTTELVISQQNN
ncbi:MAG: hypothetical protein JKY23_05390 [Nitrospinaceae bacterium]|nr:hypothetical protein [Nitrospinaceae bacterium]